MRIFAIVHVAFLTKNILCGNPTDERQRFHAKSKRCTKEDFLDSFNKKQRLNSAHDDANEHKGSLITCDNHSACDYERKDYSNGLEHHSVDQQAEVKQSYHVLNDMTTNVISDESYHFYPEEEDDGWVVEILKDFDYDSVIIEPNGNMYEEFLPLSNQFFCGQSRNNQKSINQDAFVENEVTAEDHFSTHRSTLEFRNHQQNSFDVNRMEGQNIYTKQYGIVNYPYSVQSTTVSEEHYGVQAAIIGQLSIETDANLGFSSFYDPCTHSNTFANYTGFIHDTTQQPELNEMSSCGISTKAPNAADNQLLRFCYLSFGISNDKMAFYKYCYSKRNHLCSNKHAKSKMVAETAFPHNLDVEDYTFRRTINLENARTACLYVGVTRTILFGNIAEKLNQKELKFADADRLIRGSKNSESVYTFIEGLNIDIYSYENMQDLYFMFMTCKCLEYNQHLQCWVFRDDMWGFHVFLSEFYPYIVWYMEKLNNGNTIELEAKLVTEYKSKLKEELKLLCIILELYDEIKKFDNIFDVNGNYFGMINFLVEQWRKLIQKHLEKFYPTDRATSLYYVANEMCNANIYDKDINLFEQLDVMNPLFNKIANQIKLFYMRSDRKHYAKALRGKVHLSYYKTIHFLNMTKNTAFILAFTVNFANMDPPIHNLEGIKNMKDKNGKGYHPAVIFRDYFFNQKTYNDIFEDTLTYVLYFINFIRDKKENRNTQKAIVKKYTDIRKFEKMMSKFTKKKTLTYVQRQVIYRSMILIIIGLKIK